ncbi:MAG: transposase, partial [Rhodopirellula sp.]|nr:transposase [Rhodopirellula sp.]
NQHLRDAASGCTDRAVRSETARLHGVRLPRAELLPRCPLGVRTCLGHFRQSKRRAAFFPSDLLNMPCCPASTVKMQNRVAAALEQPYEELKARLAQEPQLFMDESPTKQANQKAWLWTAVASTYAVFAIFSSRAATALPKLLGDSFQGSSTATAQKCTGGPNDYSGARLI